MYHRSSIEIKRITSSSCDIMIIYKWNHYVFGTVFITIFRSVQPLKNICYRHLIWIDKNLLREKGAVYTVIF